MTMAAVVFPMGGKRLVHSQCGQHSVANAGGASRWGQYSVANVGGASRWGQYSVANVSVVIVIGNPRW